MSSQGRWKHSREEIISQTLEKYTDFAPELMKTLTTLLDSIPVLSKGIAAAAVSSHLGKFAAVPQTSEKYWLQRGWTNDEAVLQARKRKLAGVRKTSNIKSPFGREHWLAKINPVTGQSYTNEEADNQRNALRPIRREHWIARGYSEEEAGRLAKETKERNNRNGGTKSCTYALRTEGYYEVRGHSKEEARRLLANAQTTFSLEKLIKKHGAEEGTRLWQARQNKWQTTLNSKPFEEIEDINQRKIWKAGSMSKVSQYLFEKIHCPGARWGKKTENNRGELMIQLGTNRRAMIDFAVGDKLIEFHGDYWHANPRKYHETDTIITRKLGVVTAAQIWTADAERRALIEAQGYKLFTVWESDFRTNPEKVIQECKNFLNS